MTVTRAPADALSLLNAYRAAAGEQPVADMLPAWNQACANHVAYETQNNVLTHVESSSAPGYSADGAWAGTSAVLSSGRGNPTMWDGGVYHRLGVLAPRLRHSGWAVGASEFSCMIVHGSDANAAALDATAGTPGLTLHPWPYDGADGVPTDFANNESPSPAADAGGSAPRGYLLSVSVNGPWSASAAESSDVTAATLTPDGGQALPVAISDKDAPNRNYLSGGFGIFPLGVLPSGTWLTAHAEGQVVATDYALPGAPTTNYPFSLTWRFRTGGRSPAPVYTESAPQQSPAPAGEETPAPRGGAASGRVVASLSGTRRRQSRAQTLRNGLLVRGRLSAPGRLGIVIRVPANVRRKSGLPAVLGRASLLRHRPGRWARRVRLTTAGRRALLKVRTAIHVAVVVTPSATVAGQGSAGSHRVTVVLG